MDVGCATESVDSLLGFDKVSRDSRSYVVRGNSSVSSICIGLCRGCHFETKIELHITNDMGVSAAPVSVVDDLAVDVSDCLGSITLPRPQSSPLINVGNMYSTTVLEWEDEFELFSIDSANIIDESHEQSLVGFELFLNAVDSTLLDKVSKCSVLHSPVGEGAVVDNLAVTVDGVLTSNDDSFRGFTNGPMAENIYRLEALGGCMAPHSSDRSAAVVGKNVRCTRSHGPIPELPNVQPNILERKRKKEIFVTDTWLNHVLSIIHQILLHGIIRKRCFIKVHFIL